MPLPLLKSLIPNNWSADPRSKLNTEALKCMCRAILRGATFKNAALEAGINPWTFTDWCGKGRRAEVQVILSGPRSGALREGGAADFDQPLGNLGGRHDHPDHQSRRAGGASRGGAASAGRR